MIISLIILIAVEREEYSGGIRQMNRPASPKPVYLKGIKQSKTGTQIGKKENEEGIV